MIDANLAPEPTLTVFSGFQQVISGARNEVLTYLRHSWAEIDENPPLVFDNDTGERIDLPLHEPPPGSEPTATLAPATRAVGRPRLGVVAREVTLLPRHWDWLARQPGGASVALRRLVDEARRVHADRDAERASREAAYKFMSVIAGDLAGFEEAARALFAGERVAFEARIANWPHDVRAHLQRLASAAWGTP
ncbi:conserved hypothetical protein [Burkholderiales bacterium 8X]|nr:conserved hypothetical protein [Burkholderiales bacterium 8X]